VTERGDPGLVDRYVTLGLRLGRHIDGLVDAYYGPPGRADAVAVEPVHPPDQLVAEARKLLGDIDAGERLSMDPMEQLRHDGVGCGPR